MQPTPVFLPGEFHGQRGLAGYSPWGHKELDMTEQLSQHVCVCVGFPGSSVVKNRPANTGGARDAGSMPGSKRSPGEGNGNPLQYSCLENPMDREAWWTRVHGDRVRHD